MKKCGLIYYHLLGNCKVIDKKSFTTLKSKYIEVEQEGMTHSPRKSVKYSIFHASREGGSLLIFILQNRNKENN